MITFSRSSIVDFSRGVFSLQLLPDLLLLVRSRSTGTDASRSAAVCVFTPFYPDQVWGRYGYGLFQPVTGESIFRLRLMNTESARSDWVDSSS
ncbi:hypothetical protein N7510_001215 [Penicillium lagena]|uniref:uncharacterized protein n=1 Tax=Penicillium lagena TaxID=94218 RepID=UPI0025417997|nr:uncharacterized protein N7510_001215 [Penicillium lagena]KAJ5624906.1 hypothetical protein N7510_001215 [Penicillium lagena]